MPGRPDLSVVVPVYNTGRYLEDCLAAIEKAGVADKEVILVDDGSTDGTGALCDRLASRYSGVRVAHRPNGGISAARNAGIAMSEGRYVTLVDSDDLPAVGIFDAMIEVARKTGAEIVDFGMLEFTGEPPETESARFATLKVETMSGVEATRRMLNREGPQATVCGKLYDRSLWRDVRFREGIRYEDLEVTMRLYPRVDGYAYANAGGYLYRQVADSYMHRLNPRRGDVLDVTDSLLAEAESDWPELVDAAFDRRLSARYNILGLAAADGSPELEGLRLRCRKDIKADRLRALKSRATRGRNRLMSAIATVFGISVAERLLGYYFKKL